MVQRYFVDGTTIIILPTAERKSNTGYKGIHYMAQNNTHQVCVGSKIIGWRVNLDDAVALRAEAVRRIEDGTFDDWYAEIKRQRRHKGRT